MPAAVTSPVPAPDAVSRRKMASPGPNGNDNTNLLDAPFDDGLGGAVSPSVGQSVASFGRYNDVVSGQGSLLGTKRPRPHKIWRKKYIKVMVVGDSGLGKTTLIRTLLSTPGERLQVHDGSFTPRAQFARDPGSLCSTITWRDEEDKSIWVYRVQDTPGYGDDLDMQSNIDLIIRYVEAQNQKWLDMETSRRRVDDLQEAEDPRVDVCIFCIPPHRVRPVDLKYMADISQHVPVLPVITKADTMTIREAVAYRSEVAAKLANPQSVGLREKINVFRFDRCARAARMREAGGGPVTPLLAASGVFTPATSRC